MDYFASKKLDTGYLLLVGAAAFQSYQFGRALYVYDPSGWSFHEVNLGGLLLGAIVNVTVAIAATRLPTLNAAANEKIKKNKKGNDKPKTRSERALERKQKKASIQARFAQVAFFLLMVISPILIAPALFIEWKDLPLWTPLVVTLSIVWASAPDLAIALGGFVSGKSLTHSLSEEKPPLSKSQSETSGVAPIAGAKKPTRSATAGKSLATVPCRYAGTGCEKRGTQNAMNAHAPHCEFKPTIDDSLLLKKLENK